MSTRASPPLLLAAVQVLSRSFLWPRRGWCGSCCHESSVWAPAMSLILVFMLCFLVEGQISGLHHKLRPEQPACLLAIFASPSGVLLQLEWPPTLPCLGPLTLQTSQTPSCRPSSPAPVSILPLRRKAPNLKPVSQLSSLPLPHQLGPGKSLPSLPSLRSNSAGPAQAQAPPQGVSCI